ncbi:MAG: prepilin peptidase [Candidatus Peregrinibacteria bacterium]|nr:prepilin peptidase [Candidatus Peregrinibacteria bacterium]MCB9807902.1 prepilin peptidase [Candidatus Peribacteria bacterium]
MLIALFAVLGLAFGSFSTVLIERVPQSKSVGGRSQCPKCNVPLRIHELIPVISFLVQGGTCRSCGSRIGILYPAVELLSAAIFVWAALLHSDFWIALALALALWLLAVMCIIDLQTKTIADALNIPFIITSIIYSLLIGQFTWLGLLLPCMFFGVLWVLGRGKWIGSGDILLGIGIGALAGDWRSAMASLMITYIMGALILSLLLMTGRVTRKHHVAFVPFIALGIIIVLVLKTGLSPNTFW